MKTAAYIIDLLAMNIMDEKVEYPCLKCPFNCYIKN